MSALVELLGRSVDRNWRDKASNIVASLTFVMVYYLEFGLDCCFEMVFS